MDQSDRNVDGVVRTVLYGSDDPRTLDPEEITTEPDFSPDGSRVAYVKANGDYESAGPNSTEIWVSGIDGDDREQLVPAEPLVRSPDWSPTGEQIAFISLTDRRLVLRQVDVASAEVSTILQLEGIEIVEPTWAPDGTRLAIITFETDPTSTESTTQVATVNVDGSGFRAIAAIAEAQSLSWSPDGESLLVSTLGIDPMVLRLDLDDGTTTPLAVPATLADWGEDGDIYYLEPADDLGWLLTRGRMNADRLEAVEVISEDVGFPYPAYGLSARTCSP